MTKRTCNFLTLYSNEFFCFFHHCFTFFSFPIVKKRSDHVHVVNDYADKPWTRGQVMITQTPSPQANDSADIVSVINDYADIVSVINDYAADIVSVINDHVDIVPMCLC